MKKIFAAFLTVTMLLSSTSCDLDEIISDDKDTTKSSVDITEKTDPTEEETTTSETTASETEATTPVTTTTTSVTTTTPVTTVTTTTNVTTPTVTTSKPDFPGSDYEAFLDGTLVVYIAASGRGECYHKVDTCSRMNGNVIKITKTEAEERGYRPCQLSKCFGNWF